MEGLEHLGLALPCLICIQFTLYATLMDYAIRSIGSLYCLLLIYSLAYLSLL